MISPLAKAVWAARQSARIAWYMGHGIAAGPFRAARDEADPRRARPRRAGPGLERLLADLGELFRRDLANAEAGHYPLPRDGDVSPGRLVRVSRKFLADVPVAAERRRERRARDLGETADTAGLPAYFVQNFHYQTGGYLTEDSAELYDMQVEVLFSGSANAMRRACLVPLAEFLAGRDQRRVALADIACGTGRFAGLVRQAWPRLPLTLADLSAAYLGEARRHLAGYSAIRYVEANAEALPFEDAVFDVVTSIYLFHEVPPPVRRTVAAEFARILRPGGRLIFMDSLQLGDTPGYDGMLERFPVDFHEPYYGSYIKEDLAAIFAAAGLVHRSSEPVFLSKLVVCDKPA